MKTTQHFLISGQVQGVSFRYFTQKRATDLRVTGQVRNLEDGRVEVLAQGSAEQLAEFLGHLRSGPRAAEVRDIIQKVVSSTKEMSDFKIVPDGVEPWF